MIILNVGLSEDSSETELISCEHNNVNAETTRKDNKIIDFPDNFPL